MHHLQLLVPGKKSKYLLPISEGKRARARPGFLTVLKLSCNRNFSNAPVAGRAASPGTLVQVSKKRGTALGMTVIQEGLFYHPYLPPAPQSFSGNHYFVSLPVEFW